MKNLIVAAVMVLGLSAFAQEIGSEIKPGTTDPKTNTTTTYDNPYATPPTPGTTPATGNAGAAVGLPLSAGKGAFGIRAGFGSAGLALPSGTGATATVGAPTVGLTYWASDGLSLLFDVGFGLGIVGSNTLVALSAGIGIDYHGRTPLVALRPLFNFGASFGLAAVGNNLIPGLTVNVGGGAEYFLSPNFSFRGTVGVGVPMSFANNVVFGIFTFTPGVGASFYF